MWQPEATPLTIMQKEICDDLWSVSGSSWRYSLSQNYLKLRSLTNAQSQAGYLGQGVTDESLGSIGLSSELIE